MQNKRKNKNKYFLISIFLMFFSATNFINPIYAADGELNIVYVNIRRILNEAPQQEDISKKLELAFAEEDNQIKSLEKSINSYIQKQKKTNNSDDTTNSEEDLTNSVDISNINDDILYKQRELIRLKEKFKDEFNLKRNEEIGKLQALIVKTVAEISREKNIDLVLNSAGVIYVNSRVDITSLVLSKLREKSVESKQ